MPDTELDLEDYDDRLSPQKSQQDPGDFTIE
jgi:hypothetical protein